MNSRRWNMKLWTLEDETMQLWTLEDETMKLWNYESMNERWRQCVAAVSDSWKIKRGVQQTTCTWSIRCYTQHTHSLDFYCLNTVIKTKIYFLRFHDLTWFFKQSRSSELKAVKSTFLKETRFFRCFPH